MPSSKSLKDLQSLTGCIAALCHFIPQSSKRCLPMFEVIKTASHSKHFFWTKECVKSFANIKSFLASPPILAKAMPCEPLKIYLSASDFTIADVLIKQNGIEQSPVYYVSHMLKGSETRYTKIKKLIFVLIISSRKLGQYFPGRLITVMTNQPLRRVLHKPDMSGRLASWTIETSQFNIEFTPRTSLKSQALADFVTECNFGAPKDGEILTENEKKPWVLFTDGSSTTTVGGAGVILTSPYGFKIPQAIKFHINVTNNEAENEALIAGLQLAQHLEASVVKIFSDSLLVVKQILGEYKVTHNRMTAYMEAAQNLIRCFTS